MRKKIERTRRAFEGIKPISGRISRTKRRLNGISSAYEKRKKVINIKFCGLPEIKKLHGEIFESGRRALDLARKNDPGSEKEMVECAINNNALLVNYAKKLLKFAIREKANIRWINFLREQKESLEGQQAYALEHKHDPEYIKSIRKSLAQD